MPHGRGPITIRRRAVLRAMMYLVVGARLCRPILTMAGTGRQLPPFCSLDSASNDLSTPMVYPSTGKPDVDSKLNSELFKISDVFEVMPGFGIVDDGDAPNAFATSKNLIQGTTDGTVLLGYGLLFNELMPPWWETVVAGFIAHEFGHIVQFRSDELCERLTKNQTTHRLGELHADYMAGYYLGLRKRDVQMDIKTFLDAIYSKGDLGFNNNDHHGTPPERKDAMLAGYKRGLKEMTNITQVARQGVNAIRTIDEEW